MSLPALFLACQAVDVHEWEEDEETGVTGDAAGAGIEARWVLYRSITGQLVFGVRDTQEVWK
jgi:hypothetical protein